MWILLCDLGKSLFHIVFIFTNIQSTSSELIWTPILPAEPDQVDLWTLSQSGCSCEDGSRRSGEDCACCVPRAACPCGDKNPHRCAQCGLQHHCNNMCNMTIDGAILSVSAGTLEGSLVSPSNSPPPMSCWYSLRAPPGHRVEVQLHRLVYIGASLNGKACRGGYVEISDMDKRAISLDGKSNDTRRNEGWNKRKGTTTVRICGQDQRLHPPIVLFSDSGVANILFRVWEKKGSPRFIAYYNFPPSTHPLTGNKQWGGTRIEYTDCDWLYQDVHCHPGKECYLTSPGHPGIYPPSTKCKYLFTMSSPTTRGTLSFISVDFPPERCATDYLALYAGTSTSSPIIASVCSRNKRTVRFQGPNVLLQFSSGSFVTPFQFSGFHASLHFVEDPKTSQPVPSIPRSSIPPLDSYQMSILSDPSGIQDGEDEGCLRVFSSNASRSGHFDTSTYFHSYFSFSSFSSSSFNMPHFPHPITSSSGSTRRGPLSRVHHCRLRFVGKTDEVVQISFFKYRLGGEGCSSEVSVYDGVADDGSDNLIHHICGPITREPKDSFGKFLQPEFLISSSNLLEVKLTLGEGTEPESQFIAGAFQFHSSRLEGTKKPDSVCDVMFYGANSPSRGVLKQPSTALLWNMEGELTCSYLFVPGVNQSLQLTVESISGDSAASGLCSTVCTSAGCRCQSSGVPLQKIDHVYFTDSKRERIISCLCGDVRNVTPITILATYGVDFRYHVGRYVWSSPGFNFTLSYEFPPPTLCGSTTHDAPAGLLVPPSDFAIAPTVYIFATCSWVIENRRDASLTLVVQPPSTGSCDIWNMSVEGRVRQGVDRPLGAVCGGGVKGSFFLASLHSAALIRLERRGRNMRDWLLTWHTRRSGIAITEIEQFTPKPELSRTLQGTPTGRTFIIRSGGDTRYRCALLLLLQMVALLILPPLQVNTRTMEASLLITCTFLITKGS